MNGCQADEYRAQIPEYVSARRLRAGQLPHQRALEAHLATCAACREEARDLEHLMSDLDHPELLAAPARATPDLAFLAQPQSPAAVAARATAAFGEMVVRVSAEVLAALQRPTLAGALRGEAVLRYRYDPEDPALPALVVEIDRDATNPTFGIVRVTVGDPFFPARNGCQITLVVGGVPRTQTADTHGHAVFEGIALAELPALELRVSPGPD